MRAFGGKRFTGMARTTIILALCCVLVQQGFGTGKASASESGASGDESMEAARTTYQTLLSGKRVHVGEPLQASADGDTTVYLTFDDGPSGNTSKVLDILQEEGVPGTFFTLGQSAKAYPELIKRIVADGHGLGNHSYNHVYKEVYGDFAGFWDQLQQTEDILGEIAGIRPVLVRAPGGTATNFDAFYFYYLETAGYRIHDWNVDSGDSARAGVPASEIFRTVKNSPIKPQTVVLMHDGTGHQETAKALPEIIRYYKSKGVSFGVLTGDTKPIQFGLYKPKWNRTTSFETFLGFDRKARQSAALKLAAAKAAAGAEGQPKDGDHEADLEHQAIVSAEESARALELKNNIPLDVSFGDNVWRIERSRYEFEKGSFAVPLRGLAERLGGKVVSDSGSGTMTVRLGGHLYAYSLAGKTITEYPIGGMPVVHSLADIRLGEEGFLVPLRATVELLGGAISGYRLEPGMRTVNIELTEKAVAGAAAPARIFEFSHPAREANLPSARVKS